MNKILLAIAILIAVVAVFMMITQGNDGQIITPTNNNTNQNTGTNGTNPATDGVTSSVKLAVIDTEGTSGGKMRGCDRIVLIDQNVPVTAAPLTAAMEILFANNNTEINGWHNFMAKTNDTLSFDRAVVESGVASIYLTGSLSGLAGVCDNPRARIQIEETALQFPTVTGVVIFLNGEPTTLQPDESGM